MAHQARKRFGQHFLVDEGIIYSIVRAIEPQLQDALVEIGPGLGAMTKPLLANLNHMSVVELDRDLVSHWKKKGIEKLTVYESDALKYDFQTWAKAAKDSFANSSVPGKVLIVGNLPYNISSPLLFHLMAAAEWVDAQVFMLQAEVIDRMVAAHGSSEYGRLSVMLQSRYHLEKVLDVPPEAFEPPPRVDSAVVRMIPRTDLLLSSAQYAALEKIVTMAFAQRRKVLRNNLAEVKAELALSDEILSLRAQHISVDDYISWACKLAHQ